MNDGFFSPPTWTPAGCIALFGAVHLGGFAGRSRRYVCKSSCRPNCSGCSRLVGLIPGTYPPKREFFFLLIDDMGSKADRDAMPEVVLLVKVRTICPGTTLLFNQKPGP